MKVTKKHNFFLVSVGCWSTLLPLSSFLSPHAQRGFNTSAIKNGTAIRGEGGTEGKGGKRVKQIQEQRIKGEAGLPDGNYRTYIYVY